jgi:chemotaxis response regulator CheB
LSFALIVAQEAELQRWRSVAFDCGRYSGDSMANRDIVAIGTSAGGVEALLFIAKYLPADFPASILVTMHLSSDFRSSFDQILTRAGQLKAQFASEGDALEKGHIYIAPAPRSASPSRGRPHHPGARAARE